MPIYKKIDVKLGLFDAIIGRGELNKFFMDWMPLVIIGKFNIMILLYYIWY
jgi:hypothetical protein